MYVTCINTMVSGEIGYSASRPDNSKEMYQLADLFKICIINISNCISKYIKLWVFWKRGQCLSCCGLWIICLLLHLSENNVKITQFSLHLGVLFTWQDSHYQYQYGCSTNKSQMGLKVFRF